MLTITANVINCGRETFSNLFPKVLQLEMSRLSDCLLMCICILGSSVANHQFAPGVNPQVYQQHNHQAPPPNQYAPPHQHAPVHTQGHVPLSQQQMHVPGNVEIPHHSGPVPRTPQHQPQGQVPVQGNIPQQGSAVPHGQIPVHGQAAGNSPQFTGQVPQHHPQQIQQQPQHVPQHSPQVPQQASGHHHHHSEPQVLRQDIKEEKEHIGEHFDIPVDTSKMTEQELQFHYFKMHDSDGNNKLDGCELIKSLIHWHEQGRNQPDASTNAPQPKIFTDEELSNLIDPILEMDDLDKDGYIDYAEFMHAQTKGSVKEEL